MPLLSNKETSGLGKFSPDRRLQLLDQVIAEKSPKPKADISSNRRLELLDRMIAEREVAAPIEKPGFFRKGVSAIGGGILGAGEMYGRAIRGLPGGEEAGIGEEGVSGAILGITRGIKKRLPILKEIEDAGAIYQGIRSAVTSLTARAPYMAAGAAVGTAFSPIGTFIGALGGYVFGGATLFGLAEYDSFIENAVQSKRYKQGKITKDQIESGAIKSGLHEAGWEFASDIVTATTTIAMGGMGAPVGKAGMTALKGWAKTLFKTSGKEMAKRATAIVAGEVSTEMATAGFQTEEMYKLGLTDARFMDGMKQAFGPAFVASLIFAGFFEGGVRLNRRKVKNALENTDVSPEARIEVVNYVQGEMAKISPELADTWGNLAAQSIENKESISMDEKMIDETAKIYTDKMTVSEREVGQEIELIEPTEAEMPEAPMTTISEETTNLAVAGIRPEIPKVPAPIRALGMREKPIIEPAPIEPTAEVAREPVGVEKPFRKQAWEMTLEEYLAYDKEIHPLFAKETLENRRKKTIQQALKENKPVPESVLAEYPDLKPAKKIVPEPVDVARKSVKFIGMQEQVDKPSIPLVNKLDTKSTVTYDPAKHEMTNLAEYEKAVAGEKVEAKELWEMTLREHLDFAKKELGEEYIDDYESLEPTFEEEHYSAIESYAKEGGKISKRIIDSLPIGKKKHFHKHYGRENIIDAERDLILKKIDEEASEKAKIFIEQRERKQKTEKLREGQGKLKRIESEIAIAQEAVDLGRPTSYKISNIEKDLIVKNKADKLIKAQNAKIELLKKYPDLKPLPPKPPEAKPSEAVREEIKGEVIPEVKPKVEKEKVEVTPAKKEPHEMTIKELAEQEGDWYKGKQYQIPRDKFKMIGIERGYVKKDGELHYVLANGEIGGKLEQELYDRKIKQSIESHRHYVEKALKEGKTIPPEVLKDYPDLKIEEKVEVETTPEGKEISVDLTKKEEAAVTPKQQKEYLLAEIDKAVEGAPDVGEIETFVPPTYPIQPSKATEKAYQEDKRIFDEQIKERNERYGMVTIHVPDDGIFTIVNAKQTLTEFKKKAKRFPATFPKAKVTVPGVIRKVPLKEKIGVLHKIDSKEYFTDGDMIIKGKPPAKAVWKESATTQENIKNFLATKTEPAELKYYAFQHPDYGEGVAGSPIPSVFIDETYKGIVVFQAKDGTLYNYDQLKFNAIVKRFPKAKYGTAKEEWREGLLVAYENKKPVAALMPLRIEDGAVMEDMAIKQGFIKGKLEKPTGVEALSETKSRLIENVKSEKGESVLINDLSVLGADTIRRGHESFKAFSAQMKITLSEVWDKIKHLMKEAYEAAKTVLKSERGEAVLRPKLTAAEKMLGIKPKLKPGEPLPKRARSVGLAYQKISDEAKRLEVEMGLEYPKVTRTHEDLRKQADRIMGDQEQLLKTMVKEKNFSEAEGLVIRRSAVTGIETLMKVVATKDIEKANEMHETFKDGIGHRLQDLHNEFGRNLESLKEKVGPESIAKAFANLERKLNKEDIDRFNVAAEALGMGNAKPMINFLKYLKTTKTDPAIMDYVYEYWYNSILSGIPTHVVNVASNTTWAAWQIGVHKPLLAAIDPLVARFQKRPTEYFIDEVIPALAGIKKGLRPGLRGAKEVIIKGYTTNAEMDKFAIDMGKSVGAFARSPNKHLRTIAPFVSFPTRTLRSMDIWAKQMNFQAELGSLAKRMEKQGKGKYEDLLKNPTEEMMNQASEYADYTTFMNKLGTIGTRIEKLRGEVPGGRFVVPFVRTIANLVSRGVEMTPGVGALKFLGGKVKGPQATQVLVKQIEGAMIMTIVALMFIDDEITGDAPANKAEREAFYRQGKKPWAIKIGNRWIQYRRIEPFNTPIASVGILYDTWKRTGETPSTELAWRCAAGFVNNIIDSSYLSGLTQVLDSVRKADKWPQKLTNMFDRTIASFSPISSFQRSFVRAIEAIGKKGAILRKPKGAIETLAAATPFISELVPARKNVWGEDVVIYGTPLEQWLPWKTAKVTEDAVEKEIERLNKTGLLSYPGMPAKYTSIKGKRVDFDDAQYDKLVTESGKDAKKKLDRLVDTHYFKKLSDKAKALRIKRIIKDSRKKSRNKIKRELGEKPTPGMVPWKTKKKKKPAWQKSVGFGKKPSWQTGF